MPEINGNDPKGEAFSMQKYALVIGANNSIHTPELASLKHAEDDATDVAWFLHQHACNFSHPTAVLVGKNATTQAVRQAVIHLIKNRNQDDLLLFYFIGHGYPIQTSGGEVEVYLVTSDFDPEIAVHDPSAYLSLRWIQKMLFESNKAASVIVLLDCCAAGNILKEQPPEKQLLQSLATFMKSIKESEQSYTQHNRSWAIITSTGANAASYEGIDQHDEGHTRMTGFVRHALKGEVLSILDADRNLTLGVLYDYVSTEMDKLEPPKQTPLMDGSFQRSLILANHPAPSPLITSPEDFKPKPKNGRALASVQQFFDETHCEAATFADDLDMEQVRTFLRKERVQRQDDYRANRSEPEKEKMKALGMLQGEHPSYGALLCFGRRPSQRNTITGAHTRCMYWEHSERRGQLTDNGDQDYRGSLLQQFAQARNFLVQHLSEQISISEGPEAGKIYYRVLEEALVNALIHREYVTEQNRIRAEGVVVEILSNRIEISSPGKPPVGVEALHEASKQHPGSHPRNPQIMRIFYLAEHVESRGTGIARIQQWTEEAGLPQPTITFNELTQTLTITLFRPVSTFVNTIIDEKSASIDQSRRSVPTEPVGVATEHQSSYESLIQATPTTPLPKLASTNSGSLSQSPTKTPRAVNGSSSNGSSSNNYQPPRPPSHNKSGQGGNSTGPIRWPRIVLGVLSLVLIIALVFGSAPFILAHFVNNLPPPSTIIEIASDLPTSNSYVTTELPLQNGIQMAISDANNNHVLPGYMLKLVPYNDVGSNSRPDSLVGAHNVQQAIADNLVAGIIGPANSAVAQTELPIANQAPIALISPSVTNPCFTKTTASDPACSGSNDIQAQMRPTSLLTYFRLATTDDIQGKAAADYFSKMYHKVLLINDYSDPYSNGLGMAFHNEWNRLGGQIIVQSLPEATSSTQDYQNMLQESGVPFKPDLIYFAGDDPNGTYALQALVNLANIPALRNVAFAGGDGIVDADFVQEAAQISPSAPVYASLPIQDPLQVPAGIEFPSNYTASGYTYYRPYVATAYDCTMMLIQAIKTALQKVSTPHGAHDTTGAQQFRTAIVQALAKLSYAGVTGTHSFDTNGDTTNHKVSFYQLNLSKQRWCLLSTKC